MPFDEQKLDVFRILADGSPLWVATVHGQVEAREKIGELAARTPAEYKVYDSRQKKFIDVFSKSV